MIKLTHSFLWLIIFLLCTITLHGQKYSIHIKKISVEDGFKDRNFYQPFQDREGFIWVGNPFGLDKYDGTRVKHYSASKFGFLFNKIVSLAQDDRGMLWLYYPDSKGTLIFDPIEEKVQTLESYLGDEFKFPGTAVISISADLSGNLLLGVITSKIYTWSNGKMTLVHHLKDGLIPHQVFETKKGSFWVNTDWEAINFDENWQIKQRFNKIDNDWDNLIEDEQGRLHHISWPSDQLQLLIKDRTFLYKNFINDQLEKWPYDFDKYAVVGIEPNTLNKYLVLKDNNHGYKLAYVAANGEVLAETLLPLTPPTHSFFDHQNNFWLGTTDALLIVSVVKSDFDLYLNNLKISPNDYYSARGIIEDSTGVFWVHGSGTSLRFDSHTGSSELIPLIKTENGKEKQHIIAFGSVFMKDGTDAIWMTDEKLRVMKYNRTNQMVTSFNYPDSIVNSPYYDAYPGFNRALLRDGFGKLWIGHDNGLSWINEQDQTVHQIANAGSMEALDKAEVFFMHETPEGIWLATSKGLMLFDSKQIGIKAHYHSRAEGNMQFPYDVIAHIYQDSEGFFWLSSKGGGLIKWHPQKGVLAQITEETGLSNNVIYAAYEDSYNNLWLPSNNGLNQYNKETGVIVHYTEENGIAHNEFNTASHYRGSDSALYFGGLNGFTVFNPNELVKSKISEQSSVLISGLQKQTRKDGVYQDFSGELTDSKEIAIEPEHMGFQLEFSHLDFRPTENKQYAYMIEGIDATWNYLTTPSVRINALPYGQYQLKFRAQESNGSWTPPISVSLTVSKPFYLKTWFFALCILLFLTVVSIIVRSRLKLSKRREKSLEQEVQFRTAETVEYAKTLETQTVKLEKQAIELKKLDSAKSQFFANISHELRTPLTLIMGPIDQLMREGELNDVQLSRLKRMAGNGRNLARLVEEILELSRLEAGKLEVSEVSVKLQPFLSRLFSAYESMAQRKDIRYSCKLNFYEHTSVLLDSGKVEKVVNNLLSNALKFTQTGGSVKLSVSIREESIFFVVDDNGQGIAQKDLPHIFDRFYQGEVKDMAKLQGGTGIGLALAKELVEAMGGTIEVQSKLGEGTSFQVCLPKKDGQVVATTEDILPNVTLESEDKAELVQQHPEGSYRILSVEDNPDMSDYISELLTTDYEVICAGHGKEALELLKRESIDLIISDVMMPEMDGFSLLRILKANDLYSSIPVIMLTARAEDNDKLDALTIGVDDYLTKPFLADELKARVRNLLRNSKNRTSLTFETDELDNFNLSNTDAAVVTEEVIDLKWLKKVEKTALAILNDHDFSMDQLAKALGLSTRQMQRKLKQVSGMTPNQYIQELRLELSRSYLNNLAYHTVSEVAQAVGFKSTKYFSKLFKERYGKSPSAYLV